MTGQAPAGGPGDDDGLATARRRSARTGAPAAERAVALLGGVLFVGLAIAAVALWLRYGEIVQDFRAKPA